MASILMVQLLFFSIVAIIVLPVGIAIYYYVTAKKQNKAMPGTFPEKEIKKRRIILIVAGIVSGVLAAVFIGFMAMLVMAIAYM